MITVRDDFIKRSIYTQTGDFEYNISLSVDNTTGYANFGFSGTDKILDFKIISGKILDYENNFVYGLSPDEVVNISGKCNKDWHNYYINKKPIHFSGQKEVHDLDWFYIESSNCQVGFDLYINGTKPEIAVSQINFNSGSSSGSLSFTNFNTGQNVVLFSGDFYSGELYFSGLPISGLTGSQNIPIFKTIENNFSTTGSEYSGRYTLYTNYGNVTYNSVVKDTRELELILNLQGETYIGNTGTLVLTLNYDTLLGNLIAPNLMKLNISFDYVSGYGELASGIITGKAATDADKNILLSGIIYKSGRATGDFTTNGSGYDNLIKQNVFGAMTGRYIDPVAYITGDFNEPYLIPFTGIGTGTLLSGLAGSGVFNTPVLASGFVDTSGIIKSSPFSFTGTGTKGLDINVIGLIPSGVVCMSVYQTGIISGSIPMQVTGTATGTITSPIAMKLVGSGYFNAIVTGSTFISGLVTGYGTGYWGNTSGLINKYVTSLITTGGFFTGVTGFSVKKTDIVVTGIHTGSSVYLVGYVWPNKNLVTGGIIDSGLDFTSSVMPIDTTIFYTGSGIFEAFFSKSSSSLSDNYDYLLRDVYKTGYYSGYSGFWTGYWEESFSGFGIGNITGENYTGLGLSWVSGITTGTLLNEGRSGIITYQQSPSKFLRLSGLSGAFPATPELGSTTGYAYKISGNTGVILATNYHLPKLTGNLPPSLNLSYRDKAVWFEYECLGGGANASVTFGLDRYKKFRSNGVLQDLDEGQQSPGHAVHVYKTGVTGDLEFQNSFVTSSDGVHGLDYTFGLNSGDKLYVLFSLYTLDEDYDGIFQFAWRDGVRATSQSSSYQMDNVEKQINYINPFEDGYVATEDFTYRNWDRSIPTGYLPSFLIKTSRNIFEFVSGDFPSVHPYFTGKISDYVSGDVTTPNGIQVVTGFLYDTGAIGSLSPSGYNYRISSANSGNGYQYEEMVFSTIDTSTFFELKLITGNVQYSRSQQTNTHPIGPRLSNGIDYGDITTFVDVANVAYNPYNVKFAKNEAGTRVYATGYYPAWSTKLYWGTSISSDDVFSTDVFNMYVLQKEESRLANDTLYTGRYVTALSSSGTYTGINTISFSSLLLTGATGYLLVTGDASVDYEETINDGSGYFFFKTLISNDTPSVYSGLFPYTTGFFVPTGSFNGTRNTTIYKTGYFEREISGLATGLMSNPTGSIKYSGVLETTTRQFSITEGSGYHLITGIETGYASGQSAFDTGQTNYIYSTGIETLSGISYQYVPPQRLFFTNFSGVINGSFYNVNYSKTFTGEWNFRTGSSEGTSVIDFSEELYFSGVTGYSNGTQNHMVSGSTGINIYIDRLINLGTDVGLLTISGESSIINLKITGGIIPSGN